MDKSFIFAIVVIIHIYAIGQIVAYKDSNNESNNICRGLENNTAFPNEESCTQFFICVDGNPVPNTCPPGQWFNPETCLCDSSENPECKEDEEFKCPPDGIHMFPHEEYCEKFIMCFAGFPIVMQCTEGLHFDRELFTCNLPEKAECSLQICPPYDDPSNITFIPSEVDCEKFYICFNGQPIEQWCAPGIHWNAATQMCDFPENANCTIGAPEQQLSQNLMKLIATAMKQYTLYLIQTVANIISFVHLDSRFF